MGRWSNFLNSLSTRGGAIFLLVVINGTGMGIIFHMLHHADEATGTLAAFITTTFSNFSGALLLALKGSSESSATASVGPGGPIITASTTPQANPTPPAKP